MKLIIPCTTILIFFIILSILQDAYSECLLDSKIIKNRDSIGYIGLECISKSSFADLKGFCKDGKTINAEIEFSCQDSLPYCIQYGSQG